MYCLSPATVLFFGMIVTDLRLYFKVFVIVNERTVV